MRTDNIFFCCNEKIYAYLITFSVAGEQKTYHVCKECSKLDCFNQFVISKVLLDPEEVV